MQDNFSEIWSRVTAANRAEAGPPAFDDRAALSEFIEDETSDSAYYSMLASRASLPEARRLFNRLSADERRHARLLQTAYFLLTGDTYAPKKPAPEPPRSMLEALRLRYAAETQGARAYAEAASKTGDPDLRELFTALSADEKRHAADIKRLAESLMS